MASRQDITRRWLLGSATAAVAAATVGIPVPSPAAVARPLEFPMSLLTAITQWQQEVRIGDALREALSALKGDTPERDAAAERLAAHRIVLQDAWSALQRECWRFGNEDSIPAENAHCAASRHLEGLIAAMGRLDPSRKYRGMISHTTGDAFVVGDAI